MHSLSRYFVFFVFAGLATTYAPLTQAEITDMPAAQTANMQPRSYGEKVGNKALNAVTNLTTGVLEIPKNIINTTNKSNIFYGVVGGLFKGLLNTAGRLGVGIADLVTFPLPTKAIAQPRYVWDDFDVDTHYGPVFRLDQSQETVPVAVQAVNLPIAAPAVIAPRPSAIDNSKQYRQEANQKLDSLFKKEMKK
jgi:putative exosortase-associated protein (TIGR04073 family)